MEVGRLVPEVALPAGERPRGSGEAEVAPWFSNIARRFRTPLLFARSVMAAAWQAVSLGEGVLWCGAIDGVGVEKDKVHVTWESVLGKMRPGSAHTRLAVVCTFVSSVIVPPSQGYFRVVFTHNNCNFDEMTLNARSLGSDTVWGGETVCLLDDAPGDANKAQA